MLEAFFTYTSDGTIKRDSDFWEDLAQRLAQGMRPGESVSRDDLHMLMDKLQDSRSELYLKALGHVFKKRGR